MGIGTGISLGANTKQPFYWDYNQPTAVNYARMNGSLSPLYTMKLNQQPQQTSPIDDIIAKAMAAQANAPTLQSLFPAMTPSMLNTGSVGQWGAGRFLAPNANQFGNPAQPMSGFAPNASNK